MLRYVDIKEVFAEVPNEISLAISFSGCPIHCEGCHSKHLWGDSGIYMTASTLLSILKSHKGITCVCFMGGDQDPATINHLAYTVKNKGLKVAWYSGKDTLPEEIYLANFDYIKLGPYIEAFGGLNSPKTNQRMFAITDITNQFQK